MKYFLFIQNVLIPRMSTVKTRKEGRDRDNSDVHIFKSHIVIVCIANAVSKFSDPDQAPLDIPESSARWPGPRLCL